MNLLVDLHQTLQTYKKHKSIAFEHLKTKTKTNKHKKQDEKVK